MSFTVENLEFYLLILVRMSTFVFTAPFFNSPNIPRTVKVGISFILSLICFPMVTYEPAQYVGMMGFVSIVMREAIVGLVLGYVANICLLIINFSGHMIDVEIGFSMATIFDPVSRVQVTVTGNYYYYFVMLMFLVTNMHYYLLRAIIDSFRVIPLGTAVLLEGKLYKVMADFLSEYFIIGFRIILPVFSCILVINVVLGVLARVAPQMNMFVIGLQLKVFVGLLVLVFIVSMIPSIADLIFNEIRELISAAMKAMASG